VKSAQIVGTATYWGQGRAVRPECGLGTGILEYCKLMAGERVAVATISAIHFYKF